MHKYRKVGNLKWRFIESVGDCLAILEIMPNKKFGGSKKTYSLREGSIKDVLIDAWLRDPSLLSDIVYYCQRIGISEDKRAPISCSTFQQIAEVGTHVMELELVGMSD